MTVSRFYCVLTDCPNGCYLTYCGLSECINCVLYGGCIL